MLKWEMLSRCYEKLNLAVFWNRPFAGAFGKKNKDISGHIEAKEQKTQRAEKHGSRKAMKSKTAKKSASPKYRKPDKQSNRKKQRAKSTEAEARKRQME